MKLRKLKQSRKSVRKLTEEEQETWEVLSSLAEKYEGELHTRNILGQIRAQKALLGKTQAMPFRKGSVIEKPMKKKLTLEEIVRKLSGRNED